ARGGPTLRSSLFVVFQWAAFLAAPAGGFRLGHVSTFVSRPPGEVPRCSSRVCRLLDQQPPSPQRSAAIAFGNGNNRARGICLGFVEIRARGAGGEPPSCRRMGSLCDCHERG